MEIFKDVQLLATDVDGVMTDGHLFFDGKDWRRQFYIRDGLGLVNLRAAGYPIAMITTSRSEDIRRRAENLKFDFVYDNAHDKQAVFLDLVGKSGISAKNIAYIGDDILDLPALRLCGLPIAVNDAMPEVKEVARYVTKHPGGRGAVREVADLIMRFGALS